MLVRCMVFGNHWEPISERARAETELSLGGVGAGLSGHNEGASPGDGPTGPVIETGGDRDVPDVPPSVALVRRLEFRHSKRYTGRPHASNKRHTRRHVQQPDRHQPKTSHAGSDLALTFKRPSGSSLRWWRTPPRVIDSVFDGFILWCV